MNTRMTRAVTRQGDGEDKGGMEKDDKGRDQAGGWGRIRGAGKRMTRAVTRQGGID